AGRRQLKAATARRVHVPERADERGTDGHRLRSGKQGIRILSSPRLRSRTGTRRHGRDSSVVTTRPWSLPVRGHYPSVVATRPWSLLVDGRIVDGRGGRIGSEFGKNRPSLGELVIDRERTAPLPQGDDQSA